MVEKNKYIDALRKLSLSVSVITLMDGKRKHGFTLSSFMSISVEPATMAISVDKKHTAHKLLVDQGKFVFNALNSTQEDISNRFAFLKEGDRFNVGNWGWSSRNLPVLDDALFWLDCDIIDQISSNSHSIFIGEVNQICANEGTMPLLYGQGSYQKLK